MPALNSLVTQPGSTQPPQVQGSSGGDQAFGLQGLAQQGGGGAPQQGQTGIPQQGGMQGPSHQETKALLQHLSFFRRRWQAMLNDHEVGTKNMRPEVYELMADALSDDYASLPDVMGLLKTMPTDPLEQKQWIDGHVQQDEKATQAVLQMHAAANPATGPYEEEAAKLGKPGERADLVSGAVSRFKAHAKRSKGSAKGIPIRG